jgi:hypothetical protein
MENNNLILISKDEDDDRIILFFKDPRYPLEEFAAATIIFKNKKVFGGQSSEELS